MTTLIFIAIAGAVLGGFLGWLWSASRAANEIAAVRIDAEGKIKAAESATAELRSQLDGRGRQITELESGFRSANEHRIAAETRLEEAQSNLNEQKKLLEEARQKLADAFSALAADALQSNNQAFLHLARQSFETIQTQAKGDLESRQKSIEALVSPLKEGLARYEQQIQEMEKARQNAYGALTEQLRTLSTTNEQLKEKTGTLTVALKGGPQVRGRWGEMTLRNVVELAGMSDYCDFTEQESLAGDSGRLRPDMIVRLPGNRRLAVDAKVSLQAFLDLAESHDDRERDEAMKRHAQSVRNHMNQLGARSYWERLEPTPELVVLFLPGESFFSAALEQDRTLIEDGMQKRVVLATPTTLIALLRAVAYGWTQEMVARNAQLISEQGKQLYDRVRAFVSHFQGVGTGLERAIDCYNKAAGSLESRVLPSARKFRELGAAAGDEIAEVSPIDETPRALTASERE